MKFKVNKWKSVWLFTWESVKIQLPLRPPDSGSETNDPYKFKRQVVWKEQKGRIDICMLDEGG